MSPPTPPDGHQNTRWAAKSPLKSSNRCSAFASTNIRSCAAQARRSPLADLVDLSRPHSDQKDLGLGVGDLDVRPARGIEAQLHRAVPVRDAEIDRLGLGR
jgi:hypothetical protein